MKKVLVWILFLAAFTVSIMPASAANATVSGQKRYHNFVSFLDWKRDSVKCASLDTLFLLESSGSSAFNTSGIGAMKSTIETMFARIPDSVGFFIKSFGDVADPISFEFNVQFSVNGSSGPWYTLGTPDTITIANGTAQVNFPKARVCVPDAMIRLTIKTTTSTDTTRIAEVRATPVFR